MQLDPAKSLVIAVAAVELYMIAVDEVQFAHAIAQSLLLLELRPLEFCIAAPFAPLTELRAHEQQLLAGVRAHVSAEQPEVGPLLPIVAGHLGEQGVFPVHHFIVRYRQDEILGPGVDE